MDDSEAVVPSEIYASRYENMAGSNRWQMAAEPPPTFGTVQDPSLSWTAGESPNPMRPHQWSGYQSESPDLNSSSTGALPSLPQMEDFAPYGADSRHPRDSNTDRAQISPGPGAGPTSIHTRGQTHRPSWTTAQGTEAGHAANAPISAHETPIARMTNAEREVMRFCDRIALECSQAVTLSGAPLLHPREVEAVWSQSIFMTKHILSGLASRYYDGPRGRGAFTFHQLQLSADVSVQESPLLSATVHLEGRLISWDPVDDDADHSDRPLSQTIDSNGYHLWLYRRAEPGGEFSIVRDEFFPGGRRREVETTFPALGGDSARDRSY